MTAPTTEEQYLLELVNDARLNPLGNAARYLSSTAGPQSYFDGINLALDYFNVSGSALANDLGQLTPVGPVAWNTKLATAAEKHSAAMIDADEQSHQVPGEASLGDRVAAEGYQFTKLGENVYAHANDVMYAHAGFVIDWGFDSADYTNGNLNSNFAVTGDGIQDPAGHRINIYDAAFKEVGIDVTHQLDDNADTGPLVVTQDFGSSGSGFFVTGVAYTDSDDDQFYSFGEGRGDLVVKVGGASVQSFASGGYSVAAGIGAKTIELSGGGLTGTVTVQANIADASLKLDVVDGNTLLTSGSIIVEGPVAEIRALGIVGLEITGGSGAQEIIGTIAGDQLNGGLGNDILQGGLGDDFIRGDEGTDVAVFEGRRNSYTVGTNQEGARIFISPETGQDTVEGVEIFRFADGDYMFVDGRLKSTGEAGGNTDGYNVIEGNASNQTLNGTNGPDLFIGGSGDETVLGGNGEDIAAFAGTRKSYTIATRGETIIVIGSDAGADQLEDVEILRFADGDYVMENGELVPYSNAVNQAPDAASTQNLSANKGDALNFKVLAFDPEQDPLSFVSTQAANGSVVNSGGGTFKYTPHSGFTGTDTFIVTIDDGKGGVVKQAINVEVVGEPAANSAPVVISQQLASTEAGVPVSITIEASDPDGDPLQFIAGGADNGSVTGGTGGVLVYTPDSGFTGLDDFEVTVADGNGGEASVTVSVLVEPSANVEPENQAPVLALSQVVVLNAQSVAYIKVSATDPDGDELSFAASDPAKGELTGENGMYTYQANLGLFGDEDSFIVTVDDGNGGVRQQEVSIIAPPPGLQLLLAPNFIGTIGGGASVFGTTAGQDLTFVDAPGNVDFDNSFNQGGDIIRLPHAASEYQAYLVGSVVILTDGDTNYSIPIGPAGLPIVFSDGVRELKFDDFANAIKLGSQSLNNTPAQLTSPPDGTPLPSVTDAGDSSVISTEVGAEFSMGGDYSIFGTQGAEDAHYIAGDVVFDPSFNKGGDTIHLPGSLSDYSAYFVGSTVVLVSDLGTLTIPVGQTGIDLSVDGEIHKMLIDVQAQVIKIGAQVIDGTSPQTATQLGDGSGGNGGGNGDGISIDNDPSSAGEVFSASGGAKTFLDDAEAYTDVVISGFSEDDVINVSNAGSSDYFFGTGTDATDLRITFNDGANYTEIVLDNALAGKSGFIFDYDSAVDVMGFEFITFG